MATVDDVSVALRVEVAAVLDDAQFGRFGLRASQLAPFNVFLSLDWLQGMQNPDGSWGGTYQGAMTGLALLCYLGHCETPKSAKYGETVMKGIQALQEIGLRNDGKFGNIGNKHWAYEHAIGVYALGEALILTREEGTEIPGLDEVYANGVRIIVEGQNRVLGDIPEP